MKCPNCGTENPKTAQFCRKCGFNLEGRVCPKCGTLVPKGAQYCGVCGRKLKKSSGRGHRIWKVALVTVLCLVLVVGGFSVAWKFVWSDDAQLVQAAENYAEVNEALLAVTTADGYDDLTTAEKAGQVLAALDDLADEGKVLADSVGYDEAYPLVYYSYADGAYGGVMLEEFAEGTSGVGESTYNTSISYVEGGTADIDPWPSVPTFAMEGSPYADDLSALIVCDLGEGFDDYLGLMQSLQSSWNEAYLETTLVEEGTVAFYRTGLSGYDLVVIQEHGIIYNNNPAVVLQETSDTLQKIRYSIGATVTEEERAILEDIQSNRTVLLLLEDDQFHFLLLPEFFSDYYADDGLEDAIVWIGCCDGYLNDTLVSAFADCGAKAVLAPTETVSTTYNFLMQDAFVDMLLYGNTVEESLTFAQSQWGSNDREFKEAILGVEDDDPAEVRIYCGGDETLVTLTVEGQDALKGICSGTVIDAADSSVPIVGATITVTDADGTVAEATTDETGAFEIKLYLGTYTVQIEMEGYRTVSDEVTIEAGEENAILISLSALLSDESARAAYQQFLDNGEYADRVGEVSGIQYAIYDVTGDGISELLLHCYSSDVGVDGTYYVYSYNGDVFFIGSCENVYWEGAYYSAEKNNLVIVANGDSDWISYEFYDVTDDVTDQLTLTYEMGRIFYESGSEPDTDDVLDGHFYIADAGVMSRDVTESEWNSHINELTEIVFSDLSATNDDLLYQYIPDDALIYNGHSYYYFADYSLEWEDANAYCESLGGHLVTITSEEEQNAVYNYISALAGNVDIWIGISDSDEEGNWSTWITGETVTYTNWGSGEPDDYSTGQDYGVICCGTRNGSTYNVLPGQWDDVNSISDEVNGSFICEWEYCAEQNSNTDDLTEIEETDLSDVAHGTCGDDLTWTYSSSGVLTISGTGEMWGWNPSRETNSAYTMTAITYEEIPWYDYKDQITSVVVEDGVTSIGICAFYECTSLASISIPTSVTILHSQAFFGCTSLVEVIIPDSVTSIDDQVFYNCISLTSVVIGSGVTTISYAAFYGCSSLTDVYYAGSESEWASIDIASNNECLTAAASAEQQPFYGVWCAATKKSADAQSVAEQLREQGFDAQVCLTTNWEGLNSEAYYVVTAGRYDTEAEAKAALAEVQAVGYSSAYVKYTGDWSGNG
ncbi:MAG: leucine-rich repeat protein [Clostridiales bacterium]|nr:leucine-rich repeat protein [Clostridiales bacterium]